MAGWWGGRRGYEVFDHAGCYRVTEAAEDVMLAIEGVEEIGGIPVSTCNQSEELALALSPWRKSHCVLLGSILRLRERYLGVTARKQSNIANHVVSETVTILLG